MADAFHTLHALNTGISVAAGAAMAFAGGFVAMLWLAEPGPHTCLVETVEQASWQASDPATGVPVQYGKRTRVCHELAEWEAF